MPRKSVSKKSSASKPRPSSDSGRKPPRAKVPTLESAMQAPKQALTFDIASIESKPTRSGRVGFRAKTHSGVVVTWWSEYSDGSTWRDIILDNKNGTASVKDGVRVAEDGGLIPASAPQRGSFWP